MKTLNPSQGSTPLELCTLATIRLRKYFALVPNNPPRRDKLRSYLQSMYQKSCKRKLTLAESETVLDAVGMALSRLK